MINFYGVLSFPIWIWHSSPTSKFKGTINQLQSLKKKSSLRRFADHVQDDEDVAGLLEDIREAIFDYQVCS